MSNDKIGNGLNAWAAGRGLVWFGDGNTRACYTSSERRECFQLVVRALPDGRAMIELFSIETIDDEDLHQAWSVPTEDLGCALDGAWGVVDDWKRGVGRSA